jgi:hypothetical protein
MSKSRLRRLSKKMRSKRKVRSARHSVAMVEAEVVAGEAAAEEVVALMMRKMMEQTAETSRKDSPDMNLMAEVLMMRMMLPSKSRSLKSRLWSRTSLRWLNRMYLMITSSPRCDLDKLLPSDQHWIKERCLG